MLFYWFMFGMPAISTLAIGTQRTLRRRPASMGMLFIIGTFILLIGLRYRVGTDWYNYENTLWRLSHTSFSGALLYKDPGFGVIGWISTRIGMGVYMPNFVCGAILMIGLATFVRRQADMWLAVTAAVPYLVIVVGMGYVRQAAAIGLLLIALTAFEQRRFYRFLAWLAVSALFHASSLSVLPLVGVALVRRRKALLFPLLILAAIFYGVLLQSRLDSLYSAYIETENASDSSGTLIRLVMNAVPALVFFRYRRYFPGDDLYRFLWLLFSFGTIALFGLFLILPSSTAVDRIGLYFIPLQLYVFGNIALVLSRNMSTTRLISFVTILYYGAVLFVWLNYASNAHNWLPYRLIPISGSPYQ